MMEHRSRASVAIFRNTKFCLEFSKKRFQHTIDICVRTVLSRTVAKLIAVAFFSVLLDYYVFHAFSPSFLRIDLDESWMATLARDSSHAVQWGRDVIFTYGPLNQLVTNKYSDSYAFYVIPSLLTVCALQALIIVWLIQAFLTRDDLEIVRALPFALTFVVSIAFARRNPDALYITLTFPLFVRFLVLPRPRALQVSCHYCAVFLSGALPLIKTSYIFVPFALYILLDMRSLLSRRIPVALGTFVAGFLCFFVLSGQNITNLDRFVSGQLQPAIGYADAMSLSFQPIEIFAYLAVCLFMIFMHFSNRKRLHPSSAYIALGFTLTNFVAFKAGMIRSDFHTFIAWAALGFTSVTACLGLSSKMTRRKYYIASIMSVALCATLGPYYYISVNNPGADFKPYYIYYSSHVRPASDLELEHAISALLHPRRYLKNLADENVNSINLIKQSLRFPPLSGSIDTIPSLQSEVIASGSSTGFRPSIQAYATYTHDLMQKNYDFYNGPQRPDWVVFAPESIDRRLPALCEAELWPLLVSRYDISGGDHDTLLLRRRDLASTEASAVTGVEQSLPVDRVVEVPDGKAIDVAIRLNLSIFGKIANLVFRPPIIDIELTFQDGSQKAFRLIRAIASYGFLLSPFVETTSDFESLMRMDLGPPLKKVKSFKIILPANTSFMFEPEMVISFSSFPIGSGDRNRPP